MVKIKVKRNLKTLLSEKLPPEEVGQIYKSYDIIGDIAVIRVPTKLEKYSAVIAEAIMETHKHVKSVWRQTTPVSGDFRLRGLELIAGEEKTETVYKEYGCAFKVDIKKCYFSPRLSYERMRIAKLVNPGEIVVNMFAGVGCYSILIAKHSQAQKIYSIDINPVAVEYMKENIRLNRVENRVIPILGDARRVIEEKLQRIADRVLMPLPERAYEFLEYALKTLSKVSERTVHYYGFEHAKKNEDPVEKSKTKVSQKLQDLNIRFRVTFGRVVRETGPNWYQIALDLKILS
jgi:tRNA (guanine37-N1)-methyltransferase